MKSLKIGITFNTGQSIDQLMSGSGLNQNVVFYYDMFEAMGHDVYLLTSDNQESLPQIEGKSYRTMTASDAIAQSQPFDLIMEAGLSIGPKERNLFRKNCGARIIATRFGNAAMIDSEEIFIHAGDDKKSHLRGVEMMWACPHHYRQAGYWEVLYDAPVRVAPFVWEPRFVKESYWDTTIPKKPDIILPDPNFSIVKNALTPLLIVNQFFSQYKKFAVGKIRMMNSNSFAGKDYFESNFLNNLPHLKGLEISYEQRIRFYDIFTRPDIMLVWQHINDLNYMYYEALYTGVPLVHNADLHKEVGFYYSKTDIKTAAKHLETIFNGYDRKAEQEKNKKFIDAASIYDPVMQNQYAKLLEESVQRPILS